MKIICPYCGNPFNDTLEKCPSCGAPNAGVVRRSGSQPITIDELKEWYVSKGLPPYETTRFFIGEDYRDPRAFGIYQDKNSGDFIVYKNKDSGQRAVRYRGTDEAYAVNELYQRLKEEILQQKSNAIKKNSTTQTKMTGRRRTGYSSSKGCLYKLLLIGGIPLLLMLLGFISMLNMPKDGYYLYDQTLYCHYDYVQPEDRSDWFYYSEADGWVGPQWETDVPEQLQKNRQASAYYLSEELPTTRTEPSFFDSICFQDVATKHRSGTGYYQHGESTYYHLYDDIYSGWYYYDTGRGDWYESNYEEIPYELQHSKTSEDFYYTPTWDSTTQITDFTDTAIYEDYVEEMERLQSSSTWDDDDDYDYSWDFDDSWDSGGTDWDSDW